MNLLVVIPHYYKYAPNSPLASEAQSAEKKVSAVHRMLAALKEQFEALKTFIEGLKKKG